MKRRFSVLLLAALAALLALGGASAGQGYRVTYGSDQVQSIAVLDGGLVCVFAKGGGVDCACPCDGCRVGVQGASGAAFDDPTSDPPGDTDPPGVTDTLPTQAPRLDPTVPPKVKEPPPPQETPEPKAVPVDPPSAGNPGNNKAVGKSGEHPNGDPDHYGWPGNGDKGASNGDKGAGKSKDKVER